MYNIYKVRKKNLKYINFYNLISASFSTLFIFNQDDYLIDCDGNVCTCSNRRALVVSVNMYIKYVVIISIKYTKGREQSCEIMNIFILHALLSMDSR